MPILARLSHSANGDARPLERRAESRRRDRPRWQLLGTPVAPHAGRPVQTHSLVWSTGRRPGNGPVDNFVADIGRSGKLCGAKRDTVTVIPEGARRMASSVADFGRVVPPRFAP